MAKYKEQPTKPRIVEAIQFTGMERGEPLFSEAVPSWLLGALLAGKIDLSQIELGSWVIRHADGDIVPVVDDFFRARYEPLRKKPVRKAKASLAVAAE